MKGMSVIICCYNSVGRIEPTLEHMLLQEVPSQVSWEVIVVDNNSSDSTFSLAESFLPKFDKNNISYQVVSEKKQGLSNARKKGYQCSSFDFLLYCDDDNWLEKDYINIAYQRMFSDKKIGVIGGVGRAVSNGEFPDWFEAVSPYYAVGRQEGSEMAYGAGMVIRKDGWKKMEELNFELILKDREGKSVSSGGDTEMQLIYTLLGYRIILMNELRFRHFIPQERLTKKYFQNIVRGCGNSLPAISAYHHEINGKTGGILGLFLLLTKSLVSLPFLGLKYFTASPLEKNHIRQRISFTKTLLSSPNIYLKARKKINSFHLAIKNK